MGEEKPYPSGVRFSVGLEDRATMSASSTSSSLATDDNGGVILA